MPGGLVGRDGQLATAGKSGSALCRSANTDFTTSSDVDRSGMGSFISGLTTYGIVRVALLVLVYTLAIYQVGHEKAPCPGGKRLRGGFIGQLLVGR